MLDSGAFSDVRVGDLRLGPEEALERQLRWEANASRLWGSPWQAESIVAYDQLIDEKWVPGVGRRKQRWSVQEAERAIRVTVDAAGYLVSQREPLAPRRLVLPCQGVDCRQYAECVQGVLQHAGADDVIGLGGWCILGWFRSWIPEFWSTMRTVLPMIASAGIAKIHIFGVTYLPVLGPLLWECDRHGLLLSTDSSGPILATTWKNQKKAGAKCPDWEDNVLWWQRTLAGVRRTEWYRAPPRSNKQLTLWE